MCEGAFITCIPIPTNPAQAVDTVLHVVGEQRGTGAGPGILLPLGMVQDTQALTPLAQTQLTSPLPNGSPTPVRVINGTLLHHSRLLVRLMDPNRNTNRITIGGNTWLNAL